MMVDSPYKAPCDLAGKNILLGVCGSIAAYKVAGWVRFLREEEAQVTVVMTDSARRFVSPLTFSALADREVYADMFADESSQAMAHITLPREADLILIAPATANTIAKLAAGMADDLLSTCVLAADCPVVICPAMNTKMYTHPATRKNLKGLLEWGYRVVAPGHGVLACGETGTGRLTEWESTREELLGVFSNQDLSNQDILITAGPTREPLDPARYLSNRSSGKMGYALARTARRRGAAVTLIIGPVSLAPPPGVSLITVNTAAEMAAAVLRLKAEASIIVKAAAVADFRPASYADQKIKKSGALNQLELRENQDILKTLGETRRAGQLLVGFAAESNHHLKEGLRKLHAKNVDMMVVNDILGKQTGFDVDTNQVTLVDKSGHVSLPLMSKEQTANKIWDRVIQLAAGQ